MSPVLQFWVLYFKAIGFCRGQGADQLDFICVKANGLAMSISTLFPCRIRLWVEYYRTVQCHEKFALRWDCLQLCCTCDVVTLESQPATVSLELCGLDGTCCTSSPPMVLSNLSVTRASTADLWASSGHMHLSWARHRSWVCGWRLAWASTTTEVEEQ